MLELQALKWLKVKIKLQDNSPSQKPYALSAHLT